jgi:hypothetical protein
VTFRVCQSVFIPAARLILALACFASAARLSADNVVLDAYDSNEGYLALLLINEVPFPGERSWESEADSKAAMYQILYVLDARLRYVPPRYTQRQLASVQTDNLIDLMTAGGVHGQVDGFYRDDDGHPVTVSRVRERVDYLMNIANDGSPGTFARLLKHAQRLSRDYFRSHPAEADRYLDLTEVSGRPVTGRAYSWMTDVGDFHPGGRFVRITDDYEGGLGGNRFFTLQRLTP